MKFIIHGEKIKVTEGIRSYVEEKLSKLEKYFINHEEIEARIVAKVQGHNQIIEVTIPTPNFLIRAEESHEDLYASIDLVLEKIERQIRKNKTRIKNKIRNQGLKDLVLDFEEEMLEELEEKEVVKYKRIETKPMDIDEAILEMNLLGHNFFVFKNCDTLEINILYRRKDGNYGIIETR